MKAEDRFVDRLKALLGPSERVLIGPGDDAAVIALPTGPLVATTDLSVERVDFLSEEPPECIGRRALAVNLSDLAAMGARPEFFLLSIGFRRELGEDFPLAIARGALSLADRFETQLVGGDLSAASETFVSIALWGAAPFAPLTRSGARAGDLLFVSGWPGRAAAGLRIALERSRAREALPAQFPSASLAADQEELLCAYRDPVPRVRLGLFLASEAIAHAAIDISDGLGLDAARLARASGVRCVLERERIPVSPALASFAQAAAADPIDWIVAGGDDYELLFAAAPEAAARFESENPDWGAPVTRIGQIEGGSGAVLRSNEGETDVSEMGHDHLGTLA